MEDKEDFRSAGILPTGPVSAYPRSRHQALLKRSMMAKTPRQSEEIKASVTDMAAGLLKTGRQALAKGAVSKEVRDARYETCKACPAFNPKSKRCGDCGCFMEAKTWVGGNPNNLCPRKKWRK